MVAAQFLCNLMDAVSYHIHTVLTDNGIRFTNRSRDYLSQLIPGLNNIGVAYPYDAPLP